MAIFATALSVCVSATSPIEGFSEYKRGMKVETAPNSLDPEFETIRSEEGRTVQVFSFEPFEVRIADYSLPAVGGYWVTDGIITEILLLTDVSKLDEQSLASVKHR